MAERGFYSVNNSIRIYLGAGKDNVVQRGVAPDVFVSWSPDADVGGKMTGAAGAGCLVRREVTGFTLEVTFMPTATGLRLVNDLLALGTEFPVNCVTGDETFSERLVGSGVIQNTGDVQVGTDPQPRTVTIAVIASSYQVGPMGKIIAEA